MKATSAVYHRLSSIYRTKAKSDLEYFRQILGQICLSVKITKDDMQTLPGLREQDSVVFLKNAAHIEVLRGQPLKLGEIFDINPTQKVSSWINMPPSEIQSALESHTETDVPPTDLFGLYFALLIEEHFIATHNRRPNAIPDDIAILHSLAKTILENLGVSYNVLPIPLTQYIQEM